MPWKEETIMEKKQAFIIQVMDEKESFSDICRQYNISRPTGYKILSRYQEEGLPGLKERSRARHTQTHRTSEEIEKQIVEVRLQHPVWGGRKIHAYLLRNGFDPSALPAKSTITGILHRHGLIDQEESFKRQALRRFEHEAPNDLWQMDFKGKFSMLNQKTCYPLTITDDHSRFSICLHACLHERREPVWEQLCRAFTLYGLPKQINVDNGHPWGASSLTRHTALTIDLMRLGICVSHSRPRHPQTNGKCERFHRTLKAEVLKGKNFRHLRHVQEAFDHWQHIYNYERPHEALRMGVPAERYHPSHRVMPKKLPEVTYNEGAVLRKVRGNGAITYKGEEYIIGQGFAGYYVEIKAFEDERYIEIYFCQTRISQFKAK